MVLMWVPVEGAYKGAYRVARGGAYGGAHGTSTRYPG